MPHKDDTYQSNQAHLLNSKTTRDRGRASIRPIERSPKTHNRSQPMTHGQNKSRQSKRADAASSKPTRLTSPPQTATKHSRHGQPRRRNNHMMLYALRLLIVGVGISTIAGTILSAIDPTTRITPDRNTQILSVQASPQQQLSVAAAPANALKLTQEIAPLKTVMQQLEAKNPKLLPGAFFVDLKTGAYLNWNGDSTFSAASTIKFPILVAFFHDVDAGKIRLDEKLTMKKELIGGGSGDMQYKTPGTQFTALETATKMITISDNTATNMLIERLGGAAALNQRFQEWGLTVTAIRNPLPDLPGTNTTSPRDLAYLLAVVEQGDLISMTSRDRMIEIMRRTTTRTLLPKGLGPGATIAHKTGDIGSMVGDVGLVDMPNGKRYIAVAMVKRPHNNPEAKELIRQISRAAYQQFSQPATTPFTTTGASRRVGENDEL